MLTHPVHTESLLYIVGRADLQCLILMLVSVVVYKNGLKYGTPNTWTPLNATFRIGMAVGHMFGSLLLVFLSGVCKETGFTTFGLLVLLEGKTNMRHDMVEVK
jgi:hypothetical protein